MPESLAFPGVLDLVALELGCEPATLIEALRQDAERAEVLASELSGTPLARVRMELAEPISLVAGEVNKTPPVFICNRHGCEKLSEQINYLAQDIPFELDGEEITTIRKGNNYVCPYLRGCLKELYTLIAQGNRSAGKA